MTAESTEANADTLRLELHKVLTEIFHDGVGLVETNGVLKAIDEAVTRILTCLGKVESKKPPVEVPKEFICKLSKTIMIEPVIIASGLTFEKKHITKWLKHNNTCPETKTVLSHLCLTPNHSINELITQWCLVNKYDRPDPQPSDEIVIEMFTGDIEPLLHRISSPSSVADQIEAAKELALQTSKFVNVRDFFVKELHDSITRLLTPLSNLGDEVDSNPELQENILTSLLNISTVEKSQKVIAENPLVIPLLTKSLRKGTDQTKTVSAATLTSLSGIDSNKIIIGNSEALKALIDLIRDSDDLSATGEAGYAVLNLCSDESENMEKAISEGLILALLKKILAGRNVENMVSILASICTNNQAKEKIEELGIVCDILKILRNTSCLLTGENAIEILFKMFDTIRGTARLRILQEEELLYKTFTKLARQGSDRAARKAQEILQWMEMFAEKEKRQKMLELAALN